EERVDLLAVGRDEDGAVLRQHLRQLLRGDGPSVGRVRLDGLGGQLHRGHQYGRDLHLHGFFRGGLPGGDDVGRKRCGSRTAGAAVGDGGDRQVALGVDACQDLDRLRGAGRGGRRLGERRQQNEVEHGGNLLATGKGNETPRLPWSF